MKFRSFIPVSILIMLLVVPVYLSAQESLSYGDEVAGTIEAGERAEYEFEAAAGDYLLVSLMSEDFDTYLYLLDSNDVVITSDDDGGTDLNAMISGFAIPEDGTYTIQVASFDDTSEGDFTLHLDTQEVRRIEYGQTISQETGASNIFTFTGNSGDLVTALIYAESGYDTTIELRDPNGYYLASGNYVDGQSSRLGPLILQEDGSYTLVARTEDTFTLTLSSPEPTEVVIGETQTAAFTEARQTLYFTVENNARRIMDIAIDSGNQLDTQMEIISPYGYSVMTTLDSTRSVDPVAAGTLFDTVGTYYLVVSAQNPNARLTGEITLAVNPTELARLESGPQTLDFSYIDTVKYFAIDGAAGETYRIRATVEDAESYSAPTITLYQGETELMYINFSGVDTLEFETTLTEDGEVTLVIQVYSEVKMTLELITNEV